MQLYKSSPDSPIYYWIDGECVMFSAWDHIEIESNYEMKLFNLSIENGYFKPFFKVNPFDYWNMLKSGGPHK